MDNRIKDWLDLVKRDLERVNITRKKRAWRWFHSRNPRSFPFSSPETNIAPRDALEANQRCLDWFNPNKP